MTSSCTEAVAVSRAGFGAGQGTIYLANLQCNSSESSLLECRSTGPGSFCFHSEDAGVICKGRLIKLGNSVRTDWTLSSEYGCK